jgi:hypothetical protein
MNHRAKRFALAALCVALIVILFWQRTQVQRLRTENAELRTKLTAAQVDRPREPLKPNAPVSPDPELLRLRAEVAELRRQKIQLARATPRSNASDENNSTEADKLPFETRVLHNTRGMMRLVLAILSIAADREDAGATGKFPIVNAEGQLTPKLRREWEKIVKEDDATSGVEISTVWPDVELVITDAADIRKLDGNTIVARTVPIKTPEGKWTRVYVLADGSGHRRVHETPDEVWQGRP